MKTVLSIVVIPLTFIFGKNDNLSFVRRVEGWYNRTHESKSAEMLAGKPQRHDESRIVQMNKYGDRIQINVLLSREIAYLFTLKANI